MVGKSVRSQLLNIKQSKENFFVPKKKKEKPLLEYLATNNLNETKTTGHIYDEVTNF